MMKSAIFLLFLIPLIPSVFAQNGQVFDVPENIGITPDNPLYFLDVAIDKIRLNIASTNSDKARIGMEIAEERLTEVKAMINQNKIDDVEKAQKEHDNTMKDITSRLASSEDDSTFEKSKKKLESTIEIEKRLELHKIKIDDVKEKVKSRLLLNKDRLSSNENANLENAVSGLEGAVTRVDLKIDEEKTRLKVKFSDKFRTVDFNEQVKKFEDDFDRELKIERGSSNLKSGSD